MFRLAQFSLRNRALIALVTMAAALFGTLAMLGLKQELIPSINFPTVAVVTTYPGASPEIVDRDVSSPIESAVQGIRGIESTSTTANASVSTVVVEFNYGTDLVYAEQQLQQAINRIQSTLPDEAETQVVSGGIDDFPVIQLAVTGGEADAVAQHLNDLTLGELRSLDGVREAELFGDRPERITIQVDQQKLGEHGLAMSAVNDTLDNAGVLVPAGQLTEGDQTLTVQAGDTLASVEELAGLPVLGAPLEADGTPLTLGEVTSVNRDRAPVSTISRVNGEPALTISITKRPDANTVDVSHTVRDALPQIQAELGEGVNVSVILDQAPYVEESIQTLITEGLLGLGFAVLVIFVFLLSVRATLITAISIPTSLLIAFIGLQFADYSLNLLTLGALTIAIGRVVDDSIVVTENIRRHLALHPTAALRGTERVRIIAEAVREVAGAVASATIATVAVFLPIAFVSGLAGETFRPFALTSTIALLASLFVSLTIVPVLAYWFLGGGKVRASEELAARTGKHAVVAEGATLEEPRNWLQRIYEPVLAFAIRRPAIVLVFAVLVLIGSGAAAPLMKTNFLGSTGDRTIQLQQELEPNASLDAMTEKAEALEDRLLAEPGVETVQLQFSTGGGGSLFTLSSSSSTISFTVTVAENADAGEVQETLRDEFSSRDDLGEVRIGGQSQGFGNDITVEVRGPDREAVQQGVDALTPALQAANGATQVTSSIAQTRPFIQLDVDRARTAELGISDTALGAQVAQALQPVEAGNVTIDGTTLRVYFASGEAPPTSVDALRSLEILVPPSLDYPQGTAPLSDVATVEVVDGPATVTAESGLPTAQLTLEMSGDDLGGASARIQDALDAASLPSGVEASLGGTSQQQQEAFSQLGLALLAAILIVFIVMVAAFNSLLQPLLLMISVPFAATGAILLQVVTGIPLGVASLVGVLMLVGIVATNAIVLIDLVNQFRTRGMRVREAVFEGGSRRVRPIVMTALATVLALTPMALGLTGKSGFISQPMAVIVIGGLLSSTVLTLIVLPALYTAVEARREARAERRAERNERRLAEAGLVSGERDGELADADAGGAGAVRVAESGRRRGPGHASAPSA